MILAITLGKGPFSPFGYLIQEAQGLYVERSISLENGLLKEEDVSIGGEISPGKVGDRILLISPHPDDETIAAFSYAKKSVENGAQVRLVLITNGDSSTDYAKHLSRILDVEINPKLFIEVGYRRQLETKSAARLMGIPESSVYLLGYPDGGIEDILMKYWSPDVSYVSPRTKADYSPYVNSFRLNAPYNAISILDDLTEIIETYRPNIIIVPHPEDGHGDHFATYAFTDLAVNRLGWDYRRNLMMYTYIAHYPGYPAPKGFYPQEKLLPPSSLLDLDTEWVKLNLTQEDEDEKLAAFQLYKSQANDNRQPLEKFVRENELFGVILNQELPYLEQDAEGYVSINEEKNNQVSKIWPNNGYVRVGISSNDKNYQNILNKSPRIEAFDVALQGNNLLIRIMLDMDRSDDIVYWLTMYAFDKAHNYRHLEIKVNGTPEKSEISGFSADPGIVIQRVGRQLYFLMPLLSLDYSELLSLNLCIEDSQSTVLDRAPWRTVHIYHPKIAC
ncbi:MAG: PIG-L family deacetylase [Actinobacteria bacterium]|nr:PIG-L family deacetylase [Actinomycetota bacterium]